MIKRLDNGCEAEILASNEHEVLLAAYWPAGPKDSSRFRIVYQDGKAIARNITFVPRDYFVRKYGDVL